MSHSGPSSCLAHTFRPAWPCPFPNRPRISLPLPPPQTIMSDQDNGSGCPLDPELLFSLPDELISTQWTEQCFYKLLTGQCHSRCKALHRFLTAEKKIPALDHTLRVPTLPDLSPFTGATVLVTGHWSLATPQPTPQGHFQPPSLSAAPVSLLGSRLLPLSTSAHPTSSRFLRSPLITSLHL